MSFDIITCGSATVDVFAHTDSEELTIQTKEGIQTLLAYPSGSKILIEKLQVEVGGGGTNTATGFSRLGFKTAYIGCVGSDDHAQQILTCLQKEHVTFLGHSEKGLSGYSVLLDSVAHDRTALVFKGVNDLLDYKKVSISSAPWFYFSSMLNKSFTAQIKIAQFAKKIGAKIAFNPSSYQCKLGAEQLMPILQQTHILIFNLEEARLLTGLSAASHEELQKHIYVHMGIPIVVITDGPNIMSCFDGKKLHKLKPNKVKVVEATGAGDAFSVGFVGKFILTQSISQSLKAGLASSESVLKHVGAKKGLLRRPIRK